VFDEAAEFACKGRSVSAISRLFDDPAREVIWRQRADHWEQLAIKAAKAQARRAPPDKPGAPIKRQS
jgi:hypothetical protein